MPEIPGKFEGVLADFLLAQYELSLGIGSLSAVNLIKLAAATAYEELDPFDKQEFAALLATIWLNG